MQKSAQSTTGEKSLFVASWELGIFISPSTLAKKLASSDICMTPYPGITAGDSTGVINLDDSEDDEYESCSTKVLVPLPYDMNPEPYERTDVRWAVDRSCYLPDAFGMTT